MRSRVADIVEILSSSSDEIDSRFAKDGDLGFAKDGNLGLAKDDLEHNKMLIRLPR